MLSGNSDGPSHHTGQSQAMARMMPLLHHAECVLFELA